MTAVCMTPVSFTSRIGLTSKGFGTARGLFAGQDYIRAAGSPNAPNDLTGHSCIGSGVRKLRRDNKVATPNISFHVVSSDPVGPEIRR
jgi:hypothetical protein